MYRKIKSIFFALFFITPCIFSSARFAYSQSAIERATRQSDVFDRRKFEDQLRETPSEPLKIKPKKPVVKKEEAEERFFIRKINLIGCESFSALEFSSIIGEYENKESSLSDLNILAKEIEQEYLKKGVIAVVFVPPQEIKDEEVTLRVVEARMGLLQIKDSKYFNKKRLYSYWDIKSGEILEYYKLSKILQMMNKNPDREIKAALRAGKKPGTSDIILTPQTTFPLHFISSFDNEGATTTGKTRQTYGFRHNNLLGLDDAFLMGYSFGSSFEGIYGYHSVPINTKGTSLVYGYNYSKSVPKKEFSDQNIYSYARNANLDIHQDLYNREKYIGEIYGGFDAKDKVVQRRIGVYSNDRLRIFNLGSNLIYRGDRSTASISPELDQGVSAFGASSNSNPLASRGAKTNFTKFLLTAQYKRFLPHNLQASIKFKGQVVSTKMTPQEGFAMGGIDSVRGYPSQDYIADSGFTNNIELLMPSYYIPKTWRLPYSEDSLQSQITTLAFFDYGLGMRRGAIPDIEKSIVNEISFGAGIRARLFNQALFRLEWGFPIAANRPISEQGHSRFHFSVDFQDRLPEEVERIRKQVEEENIKQFSWRLLDVELEKTSSPLRKKIFTYYYLAALKEREGKTQEAKDFYEKIIQLSRSLYQQAEVYVRGCFEQSRNLKEQLRLAANYYNSGKLIEAKQLWQRIKNEAQPQAFILEF